MNALHALYWLVYLLTGYCRLCRGRGIVTVRSYWAHGKTKLCPVCSPPAEGARVSHA